MSEFSKDDAEARLARRGVRVRVIFSKHGHVNEAAFYILDGTGYEIHDGIRYDWEAGDIAIIHNNCVHQHFNAEMSRQGLLKHLLNEAMDTRMETVDAYMQVIPPGSRSGKHRHLAEECLYVIEGYGYDLHQDCDVEITDTYSWKPQEEVKRYEWEAGDVIYVPPSTIHQHFNGDPARPARLVSAINRIYKHCGLNDLEKIEDAPEYDPEIELNEETIARFLRALS
jgi:quercetin dioxygenase-like cupin family protein